MSFQRLYSMVSLEVLRSLIAVEFLEIFPPTVITFAGISISMRFLEILTNRKKIYRKFSIKNFWFSGFPQPRVTIFLGLNSLHSRFSESEKTRSGFLKDLKTLRSENRFSRKWGE